MRRLAPALITGLLVAACSGRAGEPAAPPSSTAAPAAPGRSGDGAPGGAGEADAGPGGGPGRAEWALREYEVPAGSQPHDVAPAPDGGVWYTAQATGKLGRLDPATGRVTEVALGSGSSPHGVIVGPDGAPWVTDSGLDAIVRVDPATGAVRTFPLPGGGARANLNTAAFDGRGVLWFTGQQGVYGRLDPRTGRIDMFPAPGGRGPYGITATPAGDVWYASLAGSHITRVDVSLLGRPGEVWGAESATDRLVVVRTAR